jgi:uncharacterized protein
MPMLLGIMSDSHGDAVITRRAIELLELRGAEKLIHCGDICSESVLDEFAGHDVTFVWGNCDSPSPQMRKYIESLGLKWPKVPVELEVEGKKIAVFHGHERQFESALESGQYDYVFYGHTHRFGDDRVGKTRMINPGALYRAAVKTVATFDPASGDLDFWRIDTGEKATLRRR